MGRGTSQPQKAKVVTYGQTGTGTGTRTTETQNKGTLPSTVRARTPVIRQVLVQRSLVLVRRRAGAASRLQDSPRQAGSMSIDLDVLAERVSAVERHLDRVRQKLYVRVS
jgi:hypothetical protein